MDQNGGGRDWKFFTNYALLLAWVKQYPNSTARQAAQAIGITERTAIKILGELDSENYLTRRRKGRHNVYRVIPTTPMKRMPTIGDVPVGKLLKVIASRKTGQVAP